jgi:hypothetical protein
VASWVIDHADERAVPLDAHCDACGLQWIRPPGDAWAETLPLVALAHRLDCPGPKGG